MKIKLKGDLVFEGMETASKPKVTIRLDKKKLQQVIENLKGGATLRSQSISLGFKGDNETRAALRDLLGQDGYKAILTAKRVSVSPVERVRTNDAKVPVLDGAKLKWRKSDAIMAFARRRCTEIKTQAQGISIKTPLGRTLAREFQEMRAIVKQKTKGRWHCRAVAAHEPKLVRVKTDNGVLDLKDAGRITLYVSPTGREYIKASPLERADLIIRYPDGQRIRMARWAHSAKGRKATKAITQHTKALEHHRRKHGAQNYS